MSNIGPFIDHYDVLQLSPGADSEMIERVYRILAKRYHPDNQVTGDADRFRQVHESFEVLAQPESRAAFDACRDQHDGRSRRVLEWGTADAAAQDPDLRFAVLELLYRARRCDPLGGGLGPITLEDMLGVPREHLDFPLWYLRKRGLVEVLQNGLLAITVDGIDRVEGDASRFYRGRLLTGSDLDTGDAQASATG